MLRPLARPARLGSWLPRDARAAAISRALGGVGACRSAASKARGVPHGAGQALGRFGPVSSHRHASSVSGSASSKVFASADAAVADVPDGATLLVGGFGLTGVPENLLSALRKSGVGDLCVVSSNVGTAERGLGPLFASKQISKVVGSYVGENEIFESQFLNGELEVRCSPQIKRTKQKRRTRVESKRPSPM